MFSSSSNFTDKEFGVCSCISQLADSGDALLSITTGRNGTTEQTTTLNIPKCMLRHVQAAVTRMYNFERQRVGLPELVLVPDTDEDTDDF